MEDYPSMMTCTEAMMKTDIVNCKNLGAPLLSWSGMGGITHLNEIYYDSSISWNRRMIMVKTP